MVAPAAATCDRPVCTETATAIGIVPRRVVELGEMPHDDPAGAPLHVNGIAVADLNGDHNPDIAVAHWGSDAIAVLTSKGDGTFNTPVYYSASLQGTSSDVPNAGELRITDVDGDGYADMVWENSAYGTVGVLDARYLLARSWLTSGDLGAFGVYAQARYDLRLNSGISERLYPWLQSSQCYAMITASPLPDSE